MAPAQAAKAAPRNPSPKLLLPDDAADIVELCRTGIEREATGQSSESVADELGLNRAAYRYSRMIVMLSDRSELSASDRAAVDEALNVLTSTLQYGRAWELAEPVAIKLWGGNQRWDRITTLADRRMEQFERTFGIVIQSCVTTDEIELPYLSAEQIKQFTREIGRARRALAAFSTRIEEIHQ